MLHNVEIMFRLNRKDIGRKCGNKIHLFELRKIFKFSRIYFNTVEFKSVDMVTFMNYLLTFFLNF